MLTYSFENMEHNSLYEYLYRCIRRDILNGTIAAGEKLPSKRSFAKNLGVSVITVENAYAQLVAEGYIYAVPKSGYYVAKIKNYLKPRQDVMLQSVMQHYVTSQGVMPRSAMQQDVMPQRAMQQDAMPQSAMQQDVMPQRPMQQDVMPQRPMSRSEKQQDVITQEMQPRQWTADFVSGHMEYGQFPFTIWARLLREALSARQEALMTSAPGNGVRELRCAIADYLLQYQGMQVSEEQIIIGAGTQYLYGLLIQLLGQDKVYALENPGYAKIAQVYQSHQVKTAYIPMDDKGVQVERLEESGADIIHVSPSHHYPTGVTTPIGRRYELLAWANEKEDRYIIEDDYDCEFRLAGRPIPSLQSIDEQGKVIYMNTFTKSLTPTIRISYLVLPVKLLDRFWERLGFYSCTVSNFEQYTLAEFIARGYFEKHINRMRNYYRTKRDELLKVLEQSALSEKVRISGADAGLHFLMEVKTERTDEELTARAAKKGIRIACLSQYYHRVTEGAGVEVVRADVTGLKKGNTEVAREEIAAKPTPVSVGEWFPDSNGNGWNMQHTVIMNYAGLDTKKMKSAIQALAEAWFPEQEAAEGRE